MNLVEILSHDPKPKKIKVEDSGKDMKSQTVMGHALTVKTEFLDVIVSICTAIRPKSFIQLCKEESPMLCEGEIESELVLIPDEAMLIKSIDQKQITSWADFEYILTVIVENRLLRLY